jgi:hypothetical protein
LIGRRLAMSSWMLLSVIALLVGIIVYQQWMMAEQNKRWMRIFCESCLQTPPNTMDEPKPLAEKSPEIRAAVRKRISVPIPGAGLFRPNGGTKPQ